MLTTKPITKKALIYLGHQCPAIRFKCYAQGVGLVRLKTIGSNWSQKQTFLLKVRRIKIETYPKQNTLDYGTPFRERCFPWCVIHPSPECVNKDTWCRTRREDSSGHGGCQQTCSHLQLTSKLLGMLLLRGQTVTVRGTLRSLVHRLWYLVSHTLFA